MDLTTLTFVLTMALGLTVYALAYLSAWLSNELAMRREIRAYADSCFAVYPATPRTVVLWSRPAPAEVDPGFMYVNLPRLAA